MVSSPAMFFLSQTLRIVKIAMWRYRWNYHNKSDCIWHNLSILQLSEKSINCDLQRSWTPKWNQILVCPVFCFLFNTYTSKTGSATVIYAPRTSGNPVALTFDLRSWWVLFPMILLYPRPTKLEGVYWIHLVRPSVCPSVCRRHGFRSISQLCFGVSISYFLCMLMVATGRSILIFSDVSFKMAAWRPCWIFWFPDANFTLALNINFKLQRHNTYVYG